MTRQALRKNQAEMAPWPHMPHHDHPAQALVQKIRQRTIVGYDVRRIGKQFHTVALPSDQAADEQIVTGLILDGFVAAEARQARAGGGNGGTERELHAVELTRGQDSGVEVGHHADGLEMLWERVFL